MFRRWCGLMFVAALCYVVGCAPTPPPPSSSSSAWCPLPPSGSSQAVRAQARVISAFEPQAPISRCSADMDLNADNWRPVFTTLIEVRNPDQRGTVLWAQYGLFANDDALFRIEVLSADPSALTDYTSALRLCLDHIFIGQLEPAKETGSTEVEREAEIANLADNRGDVLIAMQIVGFTSQPDEIIAELLALPVETWPDLLKRRELTPAQVYPERVDEDFVIVAVIDPTVKQGATHHYKEKNAQAAYVNVSVSGPQGAGSVKARLCKHPTNNQTMYLWNNVVDKDPNTATQETVSYTHTSSPNTVQYDLGVRGNLEGTYRLSQCTGYAGWYAGYNDVAPSDSARCCTPP